jgi:hypothetical protein
MYKQSDLDGFKPTDLLNFSESTSNSRERINSTIRPYIKRLMSTTCIYDVTMPDAPRNLFQNHYHQFRQLSKVTQGAWELVSENTWSYYSTRDLLEDFSMHDKIVPWCNDLGLQLIESYSRSMRIRCGFWKIQKICRFKSVKVTLFIH